MNFHFEMVQNLDENLKDVDILCLWPLFLQLREVLSLDHLGAAQLYSSIESEAYCSFTNFIKVWGNNVEYDTAVPSTGISKI